MTEKRYAGTSYSFGTLNDMEPERRNALLAEAIHDLDLLIAPLKAQRDEAQRWLEQYVFEQGPGTTVIAAGDFKVKVAEDVRWTYDVDEGLSQLMAFGVTPEEFETVVQQTWKVNKAKLNELAKRGGRIRSIIDQNCHRTVTGLKFTISRAVQPEVRGPKFVSEFVPAGADSDTLNLD